MDDKTYTIEDVITLARDYVNAEKREAYQKGYIDGLTVAKAEIIKATKGAE